MRKTTTFLVTGAALAAAAGSALGDPRTPAATNEATMEAPNAVTPFDGDCVDPLDRSGPETFRSENWRYECKGALPAPRCNEDAGFTGEYETSIQRNGALLIKYVCRKNES